MSAIYRAHQINVIVLVHESQEPERDDTIIRSILGEISDLATGDVIVISATPAKEVGR
jgi:hypothetical protein